MKFSAGSLKSVAVIASIAVGCCHASINDFHFDKRYGDQYQPFYDKLTTQFDFAEFKYTNPVTRAVSRATLHLATEDLLGERITKVTIDGENVSVAVLRGGKLIYPAGTDLYGRGNDRPPLEERIQGLEIPVTGGEMIYFNHVGGTDEEKWFTVPTYHQLATLSAISKFGELFMEEAQDLERLGAVTPALLFVSDPPPSLDLELTDEERAIIASQQEAMERERHEQEDLERALLLSRQHEDTQRQTQTGSGEPSTSQKPTAEPVPEAISMEEARRRRVAFFEAQQKQQKATTTEQTASGDKKRKAQEEDQEQKTASSSSSKQSEQPVKIVKKPRNEKPK